MKTELSFEQVVRTYTSTVYGIALTHTAQRADADEVFQEVFFAYWRSKPIVSCEEHLKAWLIRTTLNFSLKITQSSWAKKTVLTEAVDKETLMQGNGAGVLTKGDVPCVLLGQPVASTRHKVRPLLSARPPVSPFETEQQTALYEALCDLPSKYLTVVQLFYFEDLSIARIAETLQVEQGTVKTRLSRARAQLRARLK